MSPAATAPHPVMVAPFVVLLAAIAFGPLATPAGWARHYAKVALGLASITLSYYFLVLHDTARVLHTAQEYVSFIALVGSLFVVSGGILVKVRGEATPTVNVLFLAVGALIANLLGTTGASMLLIRPWIRMNRYRITGFHIVFFIFIVSNVGGALTPIGDPPLFLGYLKGVPFWWVATQCWPIWLVGVGLLLACFYLLDRQNYNRAPKAVRAGLAEPPDRWHFGGFINIFFLGMILVAVFIDQPRFLRETLMLAAAAGSYFLTPKPVHHANDFSFHPIKEVALLFIGIFSTMIPALHWLEINAASLGQPTPTLYYWGSGILSSILDNAPTYLSFFSALVGQAIDPTSVRMVHEAVRLGLNPAGPELAAAPEAVRQAMQTLALYHPAQLAARSLPPGSIEAAFLVGIPSTAKLLQAISVGAVFFGANTYIGNGPNFMVKAIADQQKVHTPGFIAYILKYSLPFMGLMLAVVWLLFFR